jgi:hypothetical protein
MVTIDDANWKHVKLDVAIAELAKQQPQQMVEKPRVAFRLTHYAHHMSANPDAPTKLESYERDEAIVAQLRKSEKMFVRYDAKGMLWVLPESMGGRPPSLTAVGTNTAATIPIAAITATEEQKCMYEKVRATIHQKLTEAGDEAKLIEWLSAALLKCGWRDELEEYAKEVIRCKSDIVSVLEFEEALGPRGRADVHPPSICSNSSRHKTPGHLKLPTTKNQNPVK